MERNMQINPGAKRIETERDNYIQYLKMEVYADRLNEIMVECGLPYYFILRYFNEKPYVVLEELT